VTDNSLEIHDLMAEVVGIMERKAEKFNTIVRLRWKATSGVIHVTSD
jgi:hypothetical protein